MGGTPGRGGTILSQNAWLPVLRTLGTRPWFGSRLILSGANKAFDESGRLIDPAVRDQIQKFMAGYVDFVRGPR